MFILKRGLLYRCTGNFPLKILYLADIVVEECDGYLKVTKNYFTHESKQHFISLRDMVDFAAEEYAKRGYDFGKTYTFSLLETPNDFQRAIQDMLHE